MPEVVPSGETCAGLITMSELKEHLKLARNDTANDAILEQIANGASTQIEKFCDRTFLLTSYTEYYDIVAKGQDEIVLNQWPITDADESTFKVYSVAWNADGTETTTELTQNVDFFVYAGSGIIKFVSTRTSGLKRIKIIYKAGYDGCANVPYDIRQVIKDYCGRAWKQRDHYGVDSLSNPTVGTTTYSKVQLTEEEKRVLSAYCRVSI